MMARHGGAISSTGNRAGTIAGTRGIGAHRVECFWRRDFTRCRVIDITARWNISGLPIGTRVAGDERRIGQAGRGKSQGREVRHTASRGRLACRFDATAAGSPSDAGEGFSFMLRRRPKARSERL